MPVYFASAKNKIKQSKEDLKKTLFECLTVWRLYQTETLFCQWSSAKPVFLRLIFWVFQQDQTK